MGQWKITYQLEDGYVGEIIVSAVNKFMAWDMFADIQKDFHSPVQEADCCRVLSEEERTPAPLKLYNVHVGMRYTTDVLVEATSPAEAECIVSDNLDGIDIGDMDFANDDYDTWEEKPEDYPECYVLTKDGTYKEIGVKSCKN